MDKLSDDDVVMPWKAWLRANDLSDSTGRRLLKAGKGPRVIQLSDRRRGVTRRENRRWQESRTV